MPKILIGIPDSNKKVRRAATSEPNMKKTMRTRAEKYEEVEWTVYTFTDRMTLPHVCALINATSKKLRKLAAQIDHYSVNLEANRIRKTSE